MFTVDVRSITHTEATVVVNPVDPAMPYTFDVIEKAAFDRNYNGSVEAVVNGYIDYMTQEEKMPLAEVLENMRSVGDDYYDFSTLVKTKCGLCHRSGRFRYLHDFADGKAVPHGRPGSGQAEGLPSA
ncbi:MAG: hypothetical protein ACLS37_13070 [Alistipes sp.]